jgi:hypothetical protein
MNKKKYTYAFFGGTSYVDAVPKDTEQNPRFCKKYGILCYKLVGSLSGLPDLLVKDSEVLSLRSKANMTHYRRSRNIT